MWLSLTGNEINQTGFHEKGVNIHGVPGSRDPGHFNYSPSNNFNPFLTSFTKIFNLKLENLIPSLADKLIKEKAILFFKHFLINSNSNIKLSVFVERKISFTLLLIPFNPACVSLTLNPVIKKLNS